jgi:hypothetical protein
VSQRVDEHRLDHGTYIVEEALTRMPAHVMHIMKKRMRQSSMGAAEKIRKGSAFFCGNQYCGKSRRLKDFY